MPSYSTYFSVNKCIRSVNFPPVSHPDPSRHINGHRYQSHPNCDVMSRHSSSSSSNGDKDGGFKVSGHCNYLLIFILGCLYSPVNMKLCISRLILLSGLRTHRKCSFRHPHHRLHLRGCKVVRVRLDRHRLYLPGKDCSCGVIHNAILTLKYDLLGLD